MANYTRKNAWNEKGSFDNPDLLWYAKAVGVMQSRSLNDPTSWWFYAAIHGQYIVNNDEPGTAPPTGYPNWADIPSPPNVPTAPVPEDTVIGVYWDQCQHAGWYFPPWHRGYLYAIENILRGIIQEIGGPADWALPYWDYFGPDNQYQIPPAFTQTYLPDGTTPNPLFVTARYGPQGNGNIYIPIPPVSQKCQQDTVYTDQYGGGVTGFDHFDSATGNLEQNPHNLVHNYVGGQVSQELWGLMADPGLAALDPIFYLHHSNIDRMWAAWNNAGNSNPTNDVNWMKGPEAIGERGFVMPTPSGQPWYYTPGDVNTTEQLGYTYDNLSLVVDATPAHRNTLRLRNLAGVNEPIKPTTDMTGGGATELVGANRAPITLGGAGARTAIHIDSSGWGQVTNSFRNAGAKSLPDEVYLQLEGVKGYSDAQIYTVSVNHQYVGHISLFGIRMASTKNGPHGGAGLTIRLDITNVIDELFLKGITDPNVLDVLILPVGSVHGGECTVDKVSIYRKAQG